MSAANVAASPSRAARTGLRCVAPARKASSSQGAERLATSGPQVCTMLPRYWTPAPYAAERTRTSATVSPDLAPTTVDQLDAVAVRILDKADQRAALADAIGL